MTRNSRARCFPAKWCLPLPGLLVIAGCAAGTAALNPPADDQFGHRRAGVAGGRVTVEITPPDSSVEYLFYPALIESLHVRQGPPDSSGGELQFPVELLVKAAFADDCSELHSDKQWRAGHIIHLDLVMRRRRGMECLRVERPYRYYLRLEGLYAPGDYILKLGEGMFAFQVNDPDASSTEH